MSKHTPGPWKAGQYLGSQRWVVHMDVGDKGRGTDIVDGVHGFTPEERLANARLIAAAPEMLNTLKKCLDALVYVGPWEIPVGLIERVQGLIDKAEGNDE